jgi:catechol 2,3-dioxygenase-like lactoylglutathione lyase family enzyme
VGAAKLGHPVILTMGLALAGKQLTERPGGTKTWEVGGAQVLERGVEISKVQDMTAPGKPTVSYAYFNDPDGHGWALQKLPY